MTEKQLQAISEAKKLLQLLKDLSDKRASYKADDSEPDTFYASYHMVKISVTIDGLDLQVELNGDA